MNVQDAEISIPSMTAYKLAVAQLLAAEVYDPDGQLSGGGYAEFLVMVDGVERQFYIVCYVSEPQLVVVVENDHDSDPEMVPYVVINHHGPRQKCYTGRFDLASLL